MCNGYSNFATWNVGLELDNDQSADDAKWLHLAQAANHGNTIGGVYVRRFVFTYLPNVVMEMKQNTEAGERWEDVNWEELAEDWAAEWADEQGGG